MGNVSSNNAVLVEESEDGTITTIKLNRPKVRNAINDEMFIGLTEAVEKIVPSKSRVVVITGTDEFFSSGIDLNSLNTAFVSKERAGPDLSSPPVFRYYNSTGSQHVFSLLEKLEKPVIAKISGYCIGMAMELVLACDFRFCTGSTMFSLMEPKVGLIPDVGGTSRLTRLVDILLTARKFDGNEALRLGFVNGVAKNNEELDALVKKYTDELIDSAPLAVGMGKRLIKACYGKDVYHGMELESLVQSMLVQSKDLKIGAIARMQRKKPQWTGK
ncbi:MAG: enoyl-CoA hydratase/isomerase family protein [Promethearchaeota archaeon]